MSRSPFTTCQWIEGDAITNPVMCAAAVHGTSSYCLDHLVVVADHDATRKALQRSQMRAVTTKPAPRKWSEVT